VLRVRSLSVRVDGTRILDGVSVEVPEGRVVYLMGPNGAGKSTLIYTIVGWEGYHVDHGEILLGEERLEKLPPEERARRGLAAAFQNPPTLEGVKVGLLLRLLVERYWRVSELEALKLVNNILGLVGLPSRVLEREFHVGMSGGERKKLEMAKVIAMKPRVALLDEPDSGVDVDSLQRIGEAIKYLRDELGAGVLVVTHLARLCKTIRPDHVYVVMNGRVVREGGPELVRLIEEKGYSAVRG